MKEFKPLQQLQHENFHLEIKIWENMTTYY